MNNKKIKFFIIISMLIGATLNACHVVLRAQEIEAYTGPDIRFYDIHKPQAMHDNKICFPLKCCYPIFIEKTGDTKWFFTSAVGGPTPYMGEAVVITNPFITHIYLACGKTGNGNWFYVYFGFFDYYDPKSCNEADIIYRGNIVYILCKDTSRIPHDNYCYPQNAQYLDSATITLEIAQYLAGTSACNNRAQMPQYDEQSQEFQNALQNLFLRKDDSFYACNRLLSSTSFWTHTGKSKRLLI